MKHSYVVRLQRYWWIFRSYFCVDSPNPTQWPCVGYNIDSKDNRFVYGYVPCPFNDRFISTKGNLSSPRKNIETNSSLELIEIFAWKK